MVLASGLALIFGLRGIVNFAHGALYMLAAYVSYSLVAYSFWLALVVTPLLFAAAGVLVDRLAIRPLAGRSDLEWVLLTFGVTLIIADVVQAVWGLTGRTIAAPAGLDGSVALLGVEYPAYRLFVIIAGLTVCSALALWLRRSTIGLHVRASSTDRAVAAVVGINVNRVSAVVVALGFGLAGLAGVLAGPYLSLSPNMGAEILVTTFIVVVVGGLGSLGGAMGAAILLGLLMSFTSANVPEIGPYVPYLLMFLVLLLKPTGLAGTRTA